MRMLALVGALISAAPSCNLALANDKSLKLDYSALTFSHIACNRDLLVPEIGCNQWRGAAELQTDFSSYGLLYMKNRVHGEGTQSKFMTVGWQYDLGLRLDRQLEVGWHHHSRHVMEQKAPTVISADGRTTLTNKFPIYDAYYIRFVLYSGKK
jgi:hypothetical protein